jgi:pimeloyl-ACP methyl ester carboxylesterase
MAQRALSTYQSKGIDISGYTLEQSANDILELADELNIEQFSILGFSAGSTLGLTLLQLHEERITNAVFCGTDAPSQIFNYPGDLDLHFNTLAKMVSEDTRLKDDIPDLHKLLNNVMTKLEKQPMNLEVINPLTHQTMTVKFGTFGLDLILRMDIDDATDIPVIPRMLYDIDQGDVSVLQWFVQKRIVYAFAVPGNGLNKAIAAGVSKDRLKKIQLEAARSPFNNVVNFPFLEVREVWPTNEPQRKSDLPIKSKVHTLFLSGEFDCRTPSSQTEEIRKGFTNSTHWQVKNAGHEQILPNIIIRKAIIDFLSGKDVSHVDKSSSPVIFIPATGEGPDVSHPSIKKRSKN